MTIEILGPKSFKGPLRSPAKKGINPIFRGKIKIGDDTALCYIKPLPDFITCPVTSRLVHNSELAAEALGYVLAKHSGLKVPARAGVILLKKDQIPPDATPSAPASWNMQEDVAAWFCEDMVYPDFLRQYYDDTAPPLRRKRMIRRIVDKLTEYTSVHEIIAFDDWLLNSDRNLGNLLIGQDGPIVIDHGRIFGYPNWEPGAVGADVRAFTNRLVMVIDEFKHGWSHKLPNKNSRAHAYQRFSKSFAASGESEARKILLEFFEDDEIDAIISLISKRLSGEDYNRTVGLLI